MSLYYQTEDDHASAIPPRIRTELKRFNNPDDEFANFSHSPKINTYGSETNEEQLYLLENLSETKSHKSHDSIMDVYMGIPSPPAISIKEQFKNMSAKEKRKMVFRLIKTSLLSIIFLVCACAFAFMHDREDDHLVAVSRFSDAHILLSDHQPQHRVTIIAQVPRTSVVRSDAEHKITFSIQRRVELYDYDSTTHWMPINNQTGVLSLTTPNTTTIVSDYYSAKFTLTDADSFILINSTSDMRVVVRTDYEGKPLPVQVTVIQEPVAARDSVLIAALILGLVYILIIFEVVHRLIAAMLGSFVCLTALSLLNQRPSLHEITNWFEYDTLALLFGMMIMVGIFSESGFFEWSALQAYKLSKGNIWRLTVILCILTACLSAFLDNVTTMLLLTPVTIRLCKVINISPVPIIMSEVLFSNIGGSSTAVGDPPIVLIVNHPGIIAHKIGFFQVALYLAPIAIICCLASFLPIRIIYRNVFKQKPIVSDEKAHLEKEIELWENTWRKTRENSIEEKMVKTHLMSYIAKLYDRLIQLEETMKNQLPVEVDMKKLEEQYRIHNPKLFIMCSIILVTVVLLFFVESFLHQWLNLSLAWIAVIGATFMLLLSGIDDVDEVLHKVEWSTLLFFACLFVLMKGLEELGLINFIGDVTSQVIASVPENNRLIVAITLILWVSGLVSAFIDNIPFTAAMIPVILKLAEDPVNLPILPIIWALCLGTCMGGNGTLIGASANVVCAGLAEQQGYPISFVTFFKAGMPITLLTLTLANIYLILLHVVIGVGLSN
jgi:Na+/H+ antiporter NhaD/arsenite permease-like protein